MSEFDELRAALDVEAERRFDRAVVLLCQFTPAWESGRKHGRKSALGEIEALHVALHELSERTQGYLNELSRVRKELEKRND